MMPRREKINNVNAAKIMTNSLGHYNIFATLSLSLSLQQLTAPPFLFLYAHTRVKKNIWLPLLKCKGSLSVFYLRANGKIQ